MQESDEMEQKRAMVFIRCPKANKTHYYCVSLTCSCIDDEISEDTMDRIDFLKPFVGSGGAKASNVETPTPTYWQRV